MESPSKPLVLLANDDGYLSAGIAAMRKALLSFADVIIVAPEVEQSAASHSISLHRPLRLRVTEPNIYAIDGTPADCVYVALNTGTRILPRKPDAVVSGINHGLNLGQDVFYSGTVAAAREAALRHLSAIAVSAEPSLELEPVASFAAELIRHVIEQRGQSPPALLNVNIPPGWAGAVTAAKLGARIYEENVDFRSDPRGKEYFWIGGSHVSHGDDPDSDTRAYDAHAASITPLLLDLTNREQMGIARGLADALSSITGRSVNVQRRGGKT